MNDPELELDDLIDRVVDGGLTPAELRDAVGRLEASPDGWRRCALAFLEMQALGQVLREMDCERPTAREVIPFRPRTNPILRFAYAASLVLLAFGLGWIGRGARPNGDRGPALAAHQNGPKSASLVGPTLLSDISTGDRGLTPPARRQDAHDAGPRTTPPEPTTVLGAGLPTPPEPLTEGLLADEPNGIPLEDWLRDQPPPISAYEQAALEREGYRVEQHREVVIGTLDDGRLAAVPVDQVQLEYVGHLPL